MAYVNENEKVNKIYQDTEEAREKVKEARGKVKEAKEIVKEAKEIVKEAREIVKEAREDQDTEKVAAGKALARKNAEEKKLRQEHEFLNTKNFYEKYTLFVKLAFNNYFSFLKREGKIRECDAEEFLKSKNTEEFQNQKMRVQKEIKEDLFTSSDDDFYDFSLNFFETYGWKLMGLFN